MQFLLKQIFNSYNNHKKDYGKEIKANLESPMEEPLHPGRNTIEYEARYLKWLLFEIIGF